MPRKEINDYTFYKIVCISDDIDLCYVGSTANWKSRNYNHKNDCNNENSKNYNNKIYKTIRENGGWCNFKMIEIGKKEQLTKREAEQIEEDYRVELKANMNGKRCYVTEEQKKIDEKIYREKNKDKIKEYRDANKEKIKEYDREYNEKNRDKIKERNKEYQKEYRGRNKEKMKEYQKEYKEKNKNKNKIL